MAIEYLQTGHLTITSDVWSYGIVFRELFSLGKESYVGQNVEDMITKLKDGYHLPCPEEVNQVRYFSIDINLSTSSYIYIYIYSQIFTRVSNYSTKTRMFL